MAIVFISAKNKQGAFFWGIIMLLVLFLAVVSLIVFLPDFLNTPPKIPKEVTFVSPNTSVDLGVLDSDKIKNLELFTPVEIAFTYVVSDARGKKITGNIFAPTRLEAEKVLEASGFTVENLEEMGTGRTNPFVSY